MTWINWLGVLLGGMRFKVILASQMTDWKFTQRQSIILAFPLLQLLKILEEYDTSDYTDWLWGTFHDKFAEGAQTSTSAYERWRHQGSEVRVGEEPISRPYHLRFLHPESL